MKRKRSDQPPIRNFFSPIASSSQTSQPGDAQPREEHEDVQLSEEPGNPNHNLTSTATNDIPEPSEVGAEDIIVTTEYDRDPGRRVQIWQIPADKQDDARRFYISKGPYQQKLDKYEYIGTGANRRRFNSDWFTNFPWLEYSSHTNSAYCLPCFLFSKKPVGKCGSDTFTVTGFNKWKKVNEGKKCAFLKHMGKTPSSAHNYSVRCYETLKNSMNHIDKVLVKQAKKQVADARLRLKTSIDAMRWLMFQACPFRGNDESDYLSIPQIKKEIAKIFAEKVQASIKQEMGNSKFSIMVDESRDESEKEQMAVVLRFVNVEGAILERFLDLIHVSDTTAMTLKNSILAVLADNGLNVQDIRGQGYDGASNMRGEWNGLKALIQNVCPYAYYIHCLAHQLQLALVAASREAAEVHNFFQHANLIVNTVCASPKRNDELLDNQTAEIAREIELGELDTGRGQNQIGSLQRAGDTRWSSHYKSIKSLLKMFAATVLVLRSVANDRSATRNSRGEASGALRIMITFDFVFVLHLMEKVMQITDVLCVKLQHKSLDIANALDCVANTKALLAELREDGWDNRIEEVKAFCVKHEIIVPDMDEKYNDVRQKRNKQDNTTVLHHYRVDVFNVAIDQQVTELNDRFSSQVTELLDLCSSLDPRHDTFDKSKVCRLVEKFYPADFSSQERDRLECELPHFQLDTLNHPEIKVCKSLSDLTKAIIKTGKSSDYQMVERLLRLVITLPVSSATAERSFSAMRLVKTRLRTKLGDDFLRHCMIVYIEKELAAKFSSDEIIDAFDLCGGPRGRRANFKLVEM